MVKVSRFQTTVGQKFLFLGLGILYEFEWVKSGIGV